MSDSFFFPTYTGLLTKQHKENIGPALWEFLWLISKTTKEITEGDETIGIVLGGKPLKLSEIASELGSSERTVKRNITRLKDFEYIQTKRTPYGEIYKVRNSKKFTKQRSAKNGTSNNREEQREVPNTPREVPYLSKRSAKNGTCNKDIKDIKKDINKKPRQQKTYDEDSTYYKMAIYFHEKILVVAKEAGVSHLVAKANLQSWADEFRKLLEKGEVDKRLAKDVMDWVTTDPFWKKNVLSAGKLRTKFVELAIQMEAAKNTKKKSSVKKQVNKEDFDLNE